MFTWFFKWLVGRSCHAWQWGWLRWDSSWWYCAHVERDKVDKSYVWRGLQSNGHFRWCHRDHNSFTGQVSWDAFLTPLGLHVCKPSRPSGTPCKYKHPSCSDVFILDYHLSDGTNFHWITKLIIAPLRLKVYSCANGVASTCYMISIG